MEKAKRPRPARSRFELWISADLLADVRREAAARGLSASGYVRLRMAEAVARDARAVGRRRAAP